MKNALTLIFSAVVFGLFGCGPNPPTDTDLAKHLSRQRSDLDQLVTLVCTNPGIWVIVRSHSYPEGALTAQEEKRLLKAMRKAKVKIVRKMPDGNIELGVYSKHLLLDGWEKGFIYTTNRLSTTAESLDAVGGRKNLEGDWYMYYYISG